MFDVAINMKACYSLDLDVHHFISTTLQSTEETGGIRVNMPLKMVLSINSSQSGDLGFLASRLFLKEEVTLLMMLFSGFLANVGLHFLLQMWHTVDDIYGIYTG